MYGSLTGAGRRECNGITRRGFLQVGSLGFGGLSLTTLLTAQAQAREIGVVTKDKSIVLLFLTGGPSQIETFDPKMSAAAEYRSVTGEVSTTLSGVTFGGTFPLLAKLADKMAVVRSFTHNIGNHTAAAEHVIRGGNNPTKAGLGSIVSRLRGSNHPRTGMPTHIYVSENEADPQFMKERLRLLEATGSGSLGTTYDPFQPGGNSIAIENMRLNIPAARLHDRRALRRAFDQFQRRVEVDGTLSQLDQFEQQAFDLILGKSRDAFDLSQEDPRLVARYDTSQFNTALRIEHRSSTLGQQLLLARRLCEAGCGFVTVHNPGWDMHGGNTQFNMPNGMERLGRPVDHAVSAFIEDIEERGLSDKILLIITGEFGRTTKVKSNGGRDHWPKLSTLAFAGGGLKMGQVIGRSTRHADEPLANPITPENLLATVVHTLFDVPALRLLPNIPRDLTRLIESGRPIVELGLDG